MLGRLYKRSTTPLDSECRHTPEAVRIGLALSFGMSACNVGHYAILQGIPVNMRLNALNSYVTSSLPCDMRVAPQL